MKQALTIVLIVLVSALILENPLHALSSLAKNDPYPVFTTFYDPYLSLWEREAMKGYCVENEREWLSLSLSPFRQKAHSGRTFTGVKANLGDLEGRWNMLGLTYGPVPEGVNIDNLSPLGFAKVSIFSDIYTPSGGGPIPDDAANDTINEETFPTEYLTDPNYLVGYFSVPIHYTKVGIRFELNMQPEFLCGDFGFTIQGGVSEIKQTVTGFEDLTKVAINNNEANEDDITGNGTIPDEFCRAIPVVSLTGSTLTGADCPSSTNGFPNCMISGGTDDCTTPLIEIEDTLMPQKIARQIFQQIGLDPCNFERTSLEDLRFIFWWRHAYPVNEGRDSCWPRFSVMPSVAFNIVAPVAKPLDRTQLLSALFGNDRHVAIGADVGINLDFYDTIELAGKWGVTYFVPRTISNFRVPTDPSQSGVFPFATTVNRKPGLNFNFNLIMHAYRFLDYFSAHVEYIFVKHEEDHITLENPLESFLPDIVECRSKFNAQFFNGAINYEISPNISLGVLGQFPISQRNAYRSTTWMMTFRAVF